MGRQVGRRKRRNMTRLAIRVECFEECCGPCEMLDSCWDEGRHCYVLSCRFFTTELSVAPRNIKKNRAERCSDCIMAERCAAGDFID